jgi:HEAT repeat protein
MSARSRRPILAAVLALTFASASFADGAAPAPAATPPAPEPAKIVEALKSKDRAERLAAAEQSRSVQDDKLIAPLVALLDDDDLTVRHTAIESLGARASAEARKKAAAALAAHLPKTAKSADMEIELIATTKALGALAQPSSLSALMSDMGLDTSPDVVRARLAAVANLPCAEAIDALIQYLAKQGRGQGGLQRQACRQALKEATGEDLGAEADAWRAWWRDAKKTFDFEAAARRREAEKGKKDDAEKRKKDKKDGGDGKK